MASNGNPVQIPAISLVHGSQALTTVTVQQTSGKSLPQSGNAAPKSNEPAVSTVQAQVTLLNKYLNDSGRPDQFRVDPTSDSKFIQEINPATGEVIAEYLATEFPALARSVGISGVLIDRHA